MEDFLEGKIGKEVKAAWNDWVWED